MQLGTEDGYVFLFDIFALGKEAFDHGGLRALLEDARVTKLMYDCRHDDDALFHLCGGVRVAGTLDLQIPAARSFLADCKSPSLTPYGHALKDVLTRGELASLEAVKRVGRDTFSPVHGGSNAAWSERPLQPLLLVYSTIDLEPMFKMYDKYVRFEHTDRGVSPSEEVARTSAERMRQASAIKWN